MDSNTPADPWDIPAAPVEPVAGVVAVADDDEATEPPEETPTDASPESSPEPDTTAAEPVVEDVPEDPPTEALGTSEAIDVVEEATPAASEHRFDLGLDADEPWEEASGSFESGTAFDLIPPSAEDADEMPDFEVSEPELSETFVTSAGNGRPDHSLPQLRDPAPMFAVPDDEAIEEPPSAEEPASTEAPESRGFRIPGLSFTRKSATPESVTEIAVDDVPDEPMGDEPAAGESTEPADAFDPFAEEPVTESPDEVAADEFIVDEVPSVPTAWDDAPAPGSSDPASPFAAADEPVAEPPIEDIVEPTVDETEAEVAAPDPVPAEEAEMTPTDSETEFELTDPDLSDLPDDVAELYVTETVPKEERPPALLTVDSVPGATIAQAVDVVNAVASASDEADLAAALDRTMDQLRGKAVEFGGDAVISVRTEVQEMGGGFLVTASGTVVTLA